MVHHKLNTIIALVMILGYALFNLPTAAQATDNGLFRTIKPELVYELTIQADDGADYHQYKIINDDLGFCDVSRPVDVRACQVDLSGMVRLFRHITVVRTESELPASVQWDAWDWQTGSLKPGGYTPVVLSAEFREWDEANEQTHHWWVACSILPDNPNLAVCKEMNYIEQWTGQIIDVDFAKRAEVEYFIVRSEELLSIRETVFAAPQAADAEPSLGDLADSMYG